MTFFPFSWQTLKKPDNQAKSNSSRNLMSDIRSICGYLQYNQATEPIKRESRYKKIDLIDIQVYSLKSLKLIKRMKLLIFCKKKLYIPPVIAKIIIYNNMGGKRN